MYSETWPPLVNATGPAPLERSWTECAKPVASAQQETGFGDANDRHVLWLCNIPKWFVRCGNFPGRRLTELSGFENYSATAFSAGGAGLLGAIGGSGVEGQNTTSVDGDAWGFNIGALFDVAPATRMGIHYRSSLDYKMDGNTSFSNVPAAFAGIPLLA